MLFCLWWLLACGAPEPAPAVVVAEAPVAPPEGGRVGRLPVYAGAVFATQARRQLRIGGTVETEDGPQAATRSVGETGAWKIEVDDAQDGVPTRARVVYELVTVEDVSDGILGDGRTLTSWSPVSRKTWHVDLTTDPVAITTPDGAAPSERAHGVVMAELQRWRWVRGFANAVPDRELSPGETLDVPVELLQQLYGGDALAVRSGTLVFDGVRDGRARFLATMQLAGPLDTLDLQVDGAGTIDVDAATGRILRVGATGPVRWNVEIDERTFAGDGTYERELTMSVTEGKAPPEPDTDAPAAAEAGD